MPVIVRPGLSGSTTWKSLPGVLGATFGGWGLALPASLAASSATFDNLSVFAAVDASPARAPLHRAEVPFAAAASTANAPAALATLRVANEFGPTKAKAGLGRLRDQVYVPAWDSPLRITTNTTGVQQALPDRARRVLPRRYQLHHAHPASRSRRRNVMPRVPARSRPATSAAHRTARTRNQLIELGSKARVSQQRVIQSGVRSVEVHAPATAQHGVVKLRLERHTVRVPRGCRAWGIRFRLQHMKVEHLGVIRPSIEIR